MNYLNYCLLFVTISCIISCTQPPDYPNEPQLEYIGLNKGRILQGSRTAPNDTLAIFFSFTDGDGDLGNDDSINNIFLYDSRDSTITPYKVSAIPAQGSGNGVSGEVTILIPNRIGSGNICCIFPDLRVCQTDARYPQDTFSYEIELMDRAGHKSNKIRTEPITILCQ